jgi:hypothetical protein
MHDQFDLPETVITTNRARRLFRAQGRVVTGFAARSGRRSALNRAKVHRHHAQAGSL